MEFVIVFIIGSSITYVNESKNRSCFHRSSGSTKPLKDMTTEQTCNHQCAKCGILYYCEGCLRPFFTYKHDCKLRDRIMMPDHYAL